ncbi:MAG: ATP-binding protein [Candidatus Fimivivens sp.]
MERYREIEHSLHKKFSKTIWSKFVGAIKEYEMLSPGDSVAVCISGGKDSMLLAKLMQQLHKVSDFPFEVKFMVMDPGYLPENRKMIENNAKLMNIPITIFDANIYDYVFSQPKNSCYLCSRMRRGHLYSQAKALGCNKIALGHHFDDMIETVLISMIYGSQVRTMMPKLHSDNFEGMQLIRPLYLVRESEIIRWKNYNKLAFLQCACRFTECATADPTTSKRAEIKALIATLEKSNSQVPLNIFRSVHNIKLGAVIGYTLNGNQHSFLDSYDQDIDTNPDGGLMI